jgi:hypothetical protein
MSIATMDEKLIVRQFAGIASIDLDINKIMIF